MYYTDLVAVAEKETSRSLFCLVDAAVMLYEEELRKGKSKCHRKTTTKTISAKEEEVEEERDKRVFLLFPRKTRTPVKKFVTRRNPQQYHQNLDGAFTSSSRNPLQWPSLLLDLNAIPADDSEMNYQQNPNSSSSSSSLLLLDLYSIPADSENREVRNPNSQSSMSSCLTERKTSRKRRDVEDRKPCGKFKKAKVATFSWICRENPERLTQLMNESVSKWGERTDLMLIFEKTLFKTDICPKESRLSMPFNELIRIDFLTPVESRAIEEDINNEKKTGIGAILFDQRNVKWGVMLKRWEMKETWNYALTCGWNDIVKSNGLKQGDDISIWSFRWGGLLCFALVTPPPSTSMAPN